MRSWAAVALVLAFLAQPAGGAIPDPDDAPHPAGSACFEVYDRYFVYDFALAIDPRDAQAVEDAACALYDEDGVHLVLAAVPTLDGQPIGPYAADLLNAWGIGDERRDDGLLVLYAVDQGDVAVPPTDNATGALRIATGSGLEGTLNAIVAREAYDAAARAKRERMENGSTEASATSAAVAAMSIGLAVYVQSKLEGTRPDAAAQPFPWFTVLMVVLAIVVVLSLVRRGGGRRGYGMGPWVGGGLGGMGGWGRRGGGGGWGGGGRGGGGGFGGGRSGGGGWGGRF